MDWSPEVTELFNEMLEASDEDDLRRTGFSKVGKHKNPQIYLGLLVGLYGFAIGYDIFEGHIYEGHTLLPTIRKFEERYNLDKPVGSQKRT